MRFEKTDVSYAAMIHAVSSRLALAQMSTGRRERVRLPRFSYR